MSNTRRAIAVRKAADFFRECRDMQREGPGYFVFFALLMIIASPFLMAEIMVYLLAGRDIGWFPVSQDTGQADTRVVSTAELVSIMEPLKRPALHLAGTDRTVRSRLGGAPDLPEGLEWPQWSNVPLAFLAQIDLAEVQNRSILPDLPDRGLLFFFYDQAQSTWGFNPDDEGSWRVMYSPDDTQLKRADVPSGVAEFGRFAEKPVEFREITTYPSPDRLAQSALEMSDDTWDEIDDFRGRDFQGLPRHQLGGLPDPVQGDAMELECQLASNGIDVGGAAGYASPEAQALRPGAADWMLLLQLDTDGDTDMMWGDVGKLYFWIKRTDLAARNFDDCWMVLQCS